MYNQRYVINKLVCNFTGELKIDFTDGYFDKYNKEFIGTYFKLKYINLYEIELWERKGVGWTYLATLKVSHN